MEYVQILPVFGLGKSAIHKPWYQRLKTDKLPGFAFIPAGLYGVEVNLAQVSSIHKSLLLKKQSKVPSDRLKFIESQLLEVLDL